MTANEDSTALNGCARLSATITALFPIGVISAEVRGGGEPGALHPEELGACRDFAPRRRADFAGGRQAARLALQGLGIVDFPLLRGADGRPCWPRGVAGSITHTTAFCAAAVTRCADHASLGLDAEHIGRIDKDLWPLLFRAEEVLQLRALAPDIREIAATLRFSAKEAYYKYQFPLTAAWLDFTDVAVEVEPDIGSEGTFRLKHAAVEGCKNPRAGITGRYAFDGTLVVTAIAGPENARTFSERGSDRLGNTSPSLRYGDTR